MRNHIKQNDKVKRLLHQQLIQLLFYKLDEILDDHYNDYSIETIWNTLNPILNSLQLQDN